MVENTVQRGDELFWSTQVQDSQEVVDLEEEQSEYILFALIICIVLKAPLEAVPDGLID